MSRRARARRTLSVLLAIAAAYGLGGQLNLVGAEPVTIPNPRPQENDEFGTSVLGLGKDIIVVGAPGRTKAFATPPRNTHGRVFFFDGAGKPLDHGVIPDPDKDLPGDGFGRRLAAHGKEQLTGGYMRDLTYEAASAKNAGVGYRFDQTLKLVATYQKAPPKSGDRIGFAVAATGKNILFSASREAVKGVRAGTTMFSQAPTLGRCFKST